MVLLLLFAVILSVLPIAQSSSWTDTPFLPSSYPLAVKGPYLNSWQAGDVSGGSLPQSTPAFWPVWDDQTGWTCIVVVDDIPYIIMGSFSNLALANQTVASFTATKASFTLMAGPVAVNATFLSPLTPSDLVRQSLPFAYFYVDISSIDGAAHDVRIYSDITPQWLHGDAVLQADPNPEVAANASLINSNDFVGLQMQLQVPVPFSEVADHAQDVIGVFAMKSNSNVKYQVGEESTVRALGINSTGLQNTVDTNYSAHTLNNPFDAFAISVDLGSIQSTSDPIMWIVGMIRDPSINRTTASGASQLRSSYYWSNFSSIPDIISFVLNDFDAARSSAEAFDQMIQNVPLSHITGYSDLLSLVARQIFGTLEITVSKSSDGTWNQSDTMIFSKDMGDVSSIGTSGGTNAVDVLYAGFPAILYLNPDLGQYLLRPILEAQVSDDGSVVGQPYAPQNIGTQFPNVTGNFSPHNLGIEESGNMLVMVLAYSQRTGDLSLIQNFYPLLQSWANYLINQTFDAGFQTTSLSDGITSFNQTNLVLKGIIGISAMSSISSANNEKSDQMLYETTAQQYLQVWLDGALSQDHSRLLSSFGDQTSDGLIYNMYADKLLGLGLIPSNITSIQSGFYDSLVSANKTPFGIPLDSGNSSLSRLDWTMFSIASFLDDANDNAPAVLQPSISVLTNYAASRTNNSPLSVIYNPENGFAYSGSNSFAVGALFAPLVLGNKSTLDVDPVHDTSGHKSIVAPVVGGVVGGCIALLVSLLGVWIWRRRLHRAKVSTFGDRIKRERRGLRGLYQSEDKDSDVNLQDTILPLSPRDEVLVTPYHTETDSEANALVHQFRQPQSATRREKFAPPDWETVEDSQGDSSLAFSDAESSV
ncbi:hypothetical protein SCHPADRAFT_243997 [Schizopora paradoxa]|uniref:DUF1793-domain-containing protein n=1 Tax=Schizopora paradoxa TaxID=27342 RepID=A0A0H2SFD3_9AGAM|nr:hypothetical protein SCHPADRAFT_243997 [Schizopora paradoxa]